MGESGSGKSTLARAIVGLAPVVSGRILFDGQDITPRSHVSRRQLGRRAQIIFQDPDTALDPRMTVRNSLLEAATAFARLARPDRAGAVTSLLGLVGLDRQIADARPASLSGGQRQRVAIARALAARPEVIVADEITSALDVSVQGLILNLIRDLQVSLNLTMLFIGHNLSVVRYISDVIAVMYRGQIVEVAPTDQLVGDPQHPYTRALLASIPDIASPQSDCAPLLSSEPATPPRAAPQR